MPLHSSELARRDENTLVLRPDPLRLRWTLDDLVCSDGHAMRLVFSCSVRALDNPAERRMLEEAFLTSSTVLIADAVVVHFQNALRTAAAEVCQQKSASELLTAAGNNALVEAMKATSNRLAFSCGLEVLPPFHIEATSPTLEQHRAESMQRSLAEQRAAGQVEHFQRAADLLRQFQEIHKSAPQLAPGDVLKQLNPADQGVLLQTLILASAKEEATEAVWAVAGMSLLRIDPTKNPPTVRAINLPGALLGPLRSVQPAQGGPMLLVGARSGVLYVHPDNPGDAHAFADSQVTSQLGFSRAVLWNQQIWACHSEAGIVAWQFDHPDNPFLTLRPADLGGESPRNLQVLNESQLIFSTKDRLVLLERPHDSEDGKATIAMVPPSLGEEIVAILPDVERLIVVLANGTVQIRNKESLEVERQERRAGQVSTAALLPWLGSTRLLLATEEGPVLCVGLEDDLVTQYLSPYRGIRSLAAAADLIIGLSGDRQRIIFWQSWNPRQIAADLFIPSIARHRAADVDVA